MVSPELDEMKNKLKEVEIAQDKTKQAFVQFASKLQMDVRKEQLDSPTFTITFIEKLARFMDTVQKDLDENDKKRQQVLVSLTTSTVNRSIK